jgi:hypothetical protein
MHKRLPENKNLILHTDKYYNVGPYHNELMVYLDRGPLISQYLGNTLYVMERCAAEYTSQLGIRFDAHYPKDMPLPPHAHTNAVMSTFFDSLNSKIEWNRKGKAHDSSVRYTWCREYGKEGRPHYHVALLLNGDAYRTIGWFESEKDNLSWRIREAWATALGLPIEIAGPLIHFPDNLVYHIGRNPGEFEAFFYRASYLCKVATKRFGDWCHAFGYSRH